MSTIPFLAEWALRSTILILCGGAALWLLRAKDPSTRLAAWTAMLCGSLAIPALTAVLPQPRAGVWRAAARPVEAAVVVYQLALGPDTAAAPDSSAALPRKPAGQTRFDWTTAAPAVYLLVATAMLLRIVAGLVISGGMLRRSRATGRSVEGIPMRESDELAAPAALGILRPAIVLPAGWREWDSAKLEAVVAHERSHVRRYDPSLQLLSAIHRALLWHTPASWLLHRRMVRVAEEVSDDAAVAAIGDRASYAEILLGFLQPRNAQWQGVAMARYGLPEERIHRILDGATLSRGLTRWGLAAVVALGSPLAYITAVAHPQPIPHPPAAPQAQVATESTPPAAPLPDGSQAAAEAPEAAEPEPPAPPQQNQRQVFDAASVKPANPNRPDGRIVVGMTGRTGGPGTTDAGRVHYAVINLRFLLSEAFGAKGVKIEGPDWMESQWFQVDATMPADTTAEQYSIMLQNLLVDRFELRSHRETREVTAYSLVVGRGGPKFKVSEELPPATETDPSQRPAVRPARGPDGYLIAPRRAGAFVEERADRSRVTFQQVTMARLAAALGAWLGRPVADETGLTSKYDLIVTYSKRGLPGAAPSTGSGELRWAEIPPAAGSPGANAPVEDTAPDLFGAVQLLGLRLEPKKGSIELLIIDHLNRTPTEN